MRKLDGTSINQIIQTLSRIWGPKGQKQIYFFGKMEDRYKSCMRCLMKAAEGYIPPMCIYPSNK